jgi:hypothetical protein
MAQYRVSSSSSDSVTLEDARGRRHVARTLHDIPSVGAELHGPCPVPGFAVLSNPSTRRLCRVIFEEIDCSPEGELSYRPQLDEMLDPWASGSGESRF